MNKFKNLVFIAAILIVLASCSEPKAAEEETAVEAVAVTRGETVTECTIYVQDIFDGEEEIIIADDVVAYGGIYVIPELESHGYELASITSSDGLDYAAGQEVTVTGDLTLAYTWTSV